MKRIIARFYQSDSGNEPVREWLKDLSKADKVVIGSDIKAVEYGWPIGMPVCKPLGAGLYEVRSSIGTRRVEARVIFCILDNEMILLHGFIKKTQKTPEKEIKMARKRKGSLKNV